MTEKTAMRISLSIERVSDTSTLGVRVATQIYRAGQFTHFHAHRLEERWSARLGYTIVAKGPLVTKNGGTHGALTDSHMWTDSKELVEPLRALLLGPDALKAKLQEALQFAIDTD